MAMAHSRIHAWPGEGARVDSVDNSGMTAFMFTKLHSQTDAYKLLHAATMAGRTEL